MHHITICYSTNAACPIEAIQFDGTNDTQTERGREIMRNILKAKCAICLGLKPSWKKENKN